MARLKIEFLERVENLCHRVVDLAEAIAKQNRSRRLVEQITASGTSVGANVFEADEAMTRAEFIRCLAIATRELNETRFWIRFVSRRGWVKPVQVAGLVAECEELKRVFGTMISRSKPKKPRTAAI